MSIIKLSDRFRANTCSRLMFALVFVLAGFGMSAAIETDFDEDGDSDVHDLNTLLALGPLDVGYIVEPGAPDRFDLNDDGYVNHFDVVVWRIEAAIFNELLGPYRIGDGDLNGIVDGSDFELWNANKFKSTLRWNSGDFNCDGVADGQDFILWNQNKFTSSNSVGVPEPACCFIVLAAATYLAIARRTCQARQQSTRKCCRQIIQR